MENIFRSWTEFNKKQNQIFNGKDSLGLLKEVAGSAHRWNTSEYPKNEDWKYVGFNDLPSTRFKWLKNDEPNKLQADENFTTIQIRNFTDPKGLDLAQLPGGLKIIPEAQTSGPIFPLENYSVENPFSSFSHSFFGLGLSVEIDQSFDNQKPLKLFFDYENFSEKDLLLVQNVSLQVGEGAKADVYFEISGDRFCGLSNICVSVNVENSGEATLFFKEKGGSQSHFILNVDGQVAANAKLKCLDVTLPSRWSRHNVSVSLNDKGAEGTLEGVYINKENNFVDHHTTLNHQVGHTESKEDYRGILTDSAQAVFNGKVYIAEKASKSNSEQINKNLMLSKKAEVNTKPELQIFNDDVKAAHGATVGQMDEEQRFYLQSRGYSSEEAGRVLSKAFVFDLLDDVTPLAKSFYEQDIDEELTRMRENS